MRPPERKKAKRKKYVKPQSSITKGNAAARGHLLHGSIKATRKNKAGKRAKRR